MVCIEDLFIFDVGDTFEVNGVQFECVSPGLFLPVKLYDAEKLNSFLAPVYDENGNLIGSAIDADGFG